MSAMTTDERLRHHVDALANSLQTAVLLGGYVARVTAANADDLAKMTAALQQATTVLDAIRREGRS